MTWIRVHPYISRSGTVRVDPASLPPARRAVARAIRAALASYVPPTSMTASVAVGSAVWRSRRSCVGRERTISSIPTTAGRTPMPFRPPGSSGLPGTGPRPQQRTPRPGHAASGAFFRRSAHNEPAYGSGARNRGGWCARVRGRIVPHSGMRTGWKPEDGLETPAIGPRVQPTTLRSQRADHVEAVRTSMAARPCCPPPS